MKRFIAIATLAGILCPLLPPALAFDPNYIISDDEMTDSQSLDLNEIQSYLERGSLASYKTEDLDGKVRTAAEIIWRAAQNYHLSPKFIMGMLQREQSLIDDDDPSDKQLNWAMGYAVCDVCTTSDGEIQHWAGFAKQIDSAAQQFRDGYLADLLANGETAIGIGPGIATTIDGIDVTPANNATAALYTYTPHLHGNQNLSNIWEAYFTLNYPDGSLLQAKGEDGVWLIQYGQRRPITSKAALLSRFNPDNILAVDASTILKYPKGSAIAFPNYSLLQSPTGTIFLIVDDTRRGIDSMDTFRSIGFDPEEITQVSWEDLAPYSEGVNITMDAVYPQGHLLQDSQSGGVYFVQDGIKHPLISKTLLDINFAGWRIHPTDPAELADYPTGDKVTLPDGMLVKSDADSAVYVLSAGTRRPIVSGEVFESMGWQWENIVTVDTNTLALHPLGDPIIAEQTDVIETATN